MLSLRAKNMNKKTGLANEKAGFTLVEIITVLLIISLGMVGVLSLIVQNIQSQSLNKNTLIAFQLAQEGVEMIRDVRDTNWRNARPWRTSLFSGNYYMDYTDIVPQIAPTSAYGNLKQDANGMYKDNPYPLTPGTSYSRIITLADNAPGMRVTVNVYWIDHGKNYSYSLDALLYDWR
jgi:prepilin-type N-terminal cleavage/methylation domain-containing protein